MFKTQDTWCMSLFLTINRLILVILIFIYDIFMNIQTAIWQIINYIMLVINAVLF